MNIAPLSKISELSVVKEKGYLFVVGKQGRPSMHPLQAVVPMHPINPGVAHELFIFVDFVSNAGYYGTIVTSLEVL